MAPSSKVAERVAAIERAPFYDTPPANEHIVDFELENLSDEDDALEQTLQSEINELEEEKARLEAANQQMRIDRRSKRSNRGKDLLPPR